MSERGASLKINSARSFFMPYNQVFAFDSEGFGNMACPYSGCEAVPHMTRVIFGPGIPPESTSGAGMIIRCFCEDGHNWDLTFSDYNGGIFLDVRELPDAECVEK